MSFREKHLWISIVSSVAVWGWYFWFLIRHVAAGRLLNDHFTGDVSLAFMGCLVLVALIEVVLTFIATATTPKVQRKTKDEREMLAALKASHVALMALIALVFCVSMGAYFAGLIDDNFVGGSAVFSVTGNLMVLFANVLLACVVLAELVRAGVTLMLLRGLR
jgi:ABC-type amino acid transport system permease subunit